MVNLSSEPAFGFPALETYLIKDFFPGIRYAVPSSLSFLVASSTCSDESHRPFFLKEFYPIDILNWNISANDGLKKSFSNLFRYNTSSFFKRRIILKVLKEFFCFKQPQVDQNIFYRSVVNCYLDPQQEIARQVFLVLGWWHPHKVNTFFFFIYKFPKMVAEVTWRSYLSTFFAPFLRTFWPTSSIVKKPKFQVMLKWFSLFSEVWSTYHTKMPAFLDRMNPASKKHCHFLCDLFECYIPVVTWFERTKNSSSWDLRLNFVYIHLFLLSSLNCAPYVKVFLFCVNNLTCLGIVSTITPILLLETKFSPVLAALAS